jgi:multiple sugar transport system permease protein
MEAKKLMPVKTKIIKAKKLTKAKRAEKRTISFFLIPSFVGMLTFYIVPFFVVIFYSFVDSPINRKFVFFDNFVRLIQNSAFRRAVANTIRFSLTAVPLAVILALLLAVVLEKNIPYKSNLRTVFLSPMMVPVASIILIWQVMFHFNGAVNELNGLFGFDKIDWLKSDYSQIVVVLLFIWKNIGYNMILFMAALSNIPNDIIEVATLEGASKWQIFYKIRIPNALPYIFSGLKICTTMSVMGAIVGEFIASDRGLGYIIINSQYAMDTPPIFSSLIVISFAGAIMYSVVMLLERLCMPWIAVKEQI